MDKDRVEGKVKDIAGRAQRQVGEWTGDEEAQVKGAAKQVEGKVQNAWGQAKDAVKKSSTARRTRIRPTGKKRNGGGIARPTSSLNCRGASAGPPLLTRMARCQDANQGGTQQVRFKAKGTRQTFIGDAALRVDQIDAVGPAGVGPLGRVAKLVQHAGKLYAQLAHARSRDVGTLLFIFWTGENDLVFDIALHLPDVAGMRFRDVHHQKRHAIAVLLVKFVEGRNLPPEWRSGITSEHQHHRLLLV